MAGDSLAPGPDQPGAPRNQRKRKAPRPAAAAVDEAEVEELEREVADLDRRILEHLRRTATRLPDAAASRLAALRPSARLGTPIFLPAKAKPTVLEVPVVWETTIAEDDQELDEKVKILESKIKANMADLPKILERINETVARCDKFC